MTITDSFKTWSARAKNAAVAFLFLAAYTISMVAPFVPQTAYAASGDMSVGAFEGENSDGSWSPGNNTQYSEGDYVLYRFVVSSNAGYKTTGTIDVVYDACMFTEYFEIVDEGDADVIQGLTSSGGGDWHTSLKISLDANESTTVIFKLRLTNTAGECNGSSSHVSLNTPAAGIRGDFGNVGNKDIPIPASSIYYSPSLTLAKQVVGGTATASDFYFTTSPSVIGVVGGVETTSSEFHIPTTTNQTGSTTITDVNPAGTFTITEHASDAYTGQYELDVAATQAANVSTGCVLNADGTMTATVASGRPAIDATCTFVNKLKSGSITIIKDADPNSSQEFAFSATGVTPSTFSLIDDGTTANTRTFSNLTSGTTYDFTESNATNWDLTNIVCSGGLNSEWTTTLPTASVTLGAGDNVTCEFTNVERGQLIVQKTTLPAGDTTSFPITATATEGSIVGSPSATVTDANDHTYSVTPGTYSVAETVPSGWVETSNDCTDVVVTAGETKTCTIVNTKLSSITIVKDAKPNDAQDFAFVATGSDVPESFNLDDDSDDTLSNTALFSGLLPGTYTFSEEELNGWDLTDLECSGTTAVVDGSTVTITLAAGQTATCTFTNTKQGKLIVEKTTYPAGDTTEFSISAAVDGVGQIIGSTTGYVTDANDYTYEVTPGTYTVTEAVPTGWKLDSSTCTAVVVTAGETAHCTLVNSKLAYLTIWKVTNPTTATQSFAFSANVNGGSSNFTLANGESMTFSGLIPGETATVSELTTPGWLLTGLTCTNGAMVDPLDNTKISYTPEAGGAAGCTYTNTQLGSISGTKWEVNADGSQVGTVGLENWTIFLDKNDNGTYEELVDMITTTDGSGNYTFQNLFPGVYSVYEFLKDGWTQIFGVDDTVNVSAGEVVTGKDFGNFKNNTVAGMKWEDKNANAEWDEGETALNGWTFTLVGMTNKDEAVNLSTSSAQVDGTNGVFSFGNIAPGTYQLCEEMQEGWAQTYPVMDTESTCHSVVVDMSGQTLHFEFGNVKLAKLTITKEVQSVDPDENGMFNLNLDEEVVYENAQDGDTTGEVYVMPGTFNISETAGDNTDMSHYDSAYQCVETSAPWQVMKAMGSGTTLDLAVATGENIECTFINSKHAKLTVVKDARPDGAQLFDFTIAGKSDAGRFALSDDGSGEDNQVTIHESMGYYRVTELSAGKDWVLTGAVCDEGASVVNTDLSAGILDIWLDPGTDATCTFTNTKLATLNIVKDAQSDSPRTFAFTASIKDALGIDTAFNLIDDGVTAGANKKAFTGLLPGTYTVTESAAASWNLSSISCGDGVSFTRDGSKLTVTLAPGANVTCTFVNTFIPQVLADTGNSVVTSILVAMTTIGTALWVVFSRRKTATNN